MANRSISISLPEYLISDLAETAKTSKRTVSSIVQELLDTRHYANLELKKTLADRVWKESV